jgi:hypothetical protein
MPEHVEDDQNARIRVLLRDGGVRELGKVAILPDAHFTWGAVAGTKAE